MNGFNHKMGEYLDIDSAKIYYEVIGNNAAPALLFLHGGFSNIEEFNEITPELVEKFKVIGIDSRGQGKSILGSEELTYELLQKDVEKVLQHLNLTPINIIGFSDGGIVAYRLASLSGLRVNKLITIGASWHKKYIEAKKEVLLKFAGESVKIKYPAIYDSYQKLNPEPDFNHLTQQILKMWFENYS